MPGRSNEKVASAQKLFEGVVHFATELLGCVSELQATVRSVVLNLLNVKYGNFLKLKLHIYSLPLKVTSRSSKVHLTSLHVE